MTEPLTDALLLILCLTGLIVSWVQRIVADELDKAAERGKRNFGRNI